MLDTVLPRPGFVHGYYPQRQLQEDWWLDRVAASLWGAFQRRFRGRANHFRSIVDSVQRYESEVRDLPDAGLRSRARDLRIALSHDGFTDELVGQAFALIREIAERTVGMRHFDVQLIGGWLLMNGMVAEMETGEGKTLTATLAAGTAALAGIPVHIVTVNDYLVTRDAEWMGPIYATLGLTVGTITEGLNTVDRQAAYRCDITYCTNKQLVFDYLRDRLTLGKQSSRLQLQLERLYGDQAKAKGLLLRGLCYAIVDEADSVLIDEARTPLIISKETESLQEESTYHKALELASQLLEGRDFTIDPRFRSAELTETGKAEVFNLVQPLGGVWRGRQRSQELITQALTAQRLFLRDKHYLLTDGKVEIVDEFTGRTMADRSWERGLHQMIEAKEECRITAQKDTLARISYQQFFRRYLRLAGMTGTAQEVAGELWSVYRLNVVRVPTHRSLRRVRDRVQVYKSAAEKWAAIVDRVKELQAQGRPVLIGTRSVAASEHLSELFDRKGLLHWVLNARQNAHEAEVIRHAGEPRRITIATNMAGRGTDIKLAKGVAELGGLHIIATELHEARRIDRQLYGRCGRQGDPGAYEVMLSLEDELISTYALTFIKRLLPHLMRTEASDSASVRLLFTMAQKVAERRHARLRHNLLKVDTYLKNVLAFSGAVE